MNWFGNVSQVALELLATHELAVATGYGFACETVAAPHSADDIPVTRRGDPIIVTKGTQTQVDPWRAVNDKASFPPFQALLHLNMQGGNEWKALA